ncbi:MAG: Fis family transcriptional regulator [Pseudomonadota bacterium]|nr:Fis family transcriptional regulator [Pseudomonadota bacterium]
MKNKLTGSSFDDFLAEENLETEVAAKAAKRTFVNQLEKQIRRKKVKKNAFRKAFHSPTTTNRVFDDHVGVSLQTLSKAASIVDCDIAISLVPRVAKKA